MSPTRLATVGSHAFWRRRDLHTALVYYEPVAIAGPYCRGVRLAMLRLRLSHRLHRDAQSVARRNDQAWHRPLPLAERQVGMGRAANYEGRIDGHRQYQNLQH